MSDRLDTVEKRKAYLAEKIADERELLACGKDIIAVVRAFDGKVYNKKFDEALKQKTGLFVKSEMTGYGSFNITIYSPKNYQMSCSFSIPVNTGFTATESGKYRIKKQGIVSEIKEQMLTRSKIKDELEANLKAGHIEKAREELSEIVKALRELRQKYNATILSVAGCDFSFRPAGYTEFSDYDFYV